VDPSRYEPWWLSLSPDEQQAALDVDDALPTWMAESLRSAHIAIADIEWPDGSHGLLMTTRFREWLDRKRSDSAN
jgi:hypothetical protein